MILLLIGVVAFLFFEKQSTPRTQPPPPSATPTPMPSPPSVTITELVKSLYANTIGQDKDADPILEAEAEVMAIASLLESQPSSTDLRISQALVSSRRICVLMQQAIKTTNEARRRFDANERGPHSALNGTAGVKFFGSNIEKQWRADLAKIRSEADPEWARLQKLETSDPAPILSSDTQTQARSLIAARRAKQTAKQREAARKAAAPPPPVSRMQRIGGG